MKPALLLSRANDECSRHNLKLSPRRFLFAIHVEVRYMKVYADRKVVLRSQLDAILGKDAMESVRIVLRKTFFVCIDSAGSLHSKLDLHVISELMLSNRSSFRRRLRPGNYRHQAGEWTK